MSSENLDSADNQQERPSIVARYWRATGSESSETTRRTPPRKRGEDMVPSAWRHAGATSRKDELLTLDASSRLEEDIERNSLSGNGIGKLPHESARTRGKPAHIGEALPAHVRAAGNPEGSPSDPVTTDPKGEADSSSRVCNTPALIIQGDTYEAVTELDPWFVTGLTEGEGCFCASLAVRRKMRTGLEVRPSFALSLNEKDVSLLEDLRTYFRCGWIRESRGDRTFKYEVRSTNELVESVLPHFDAFPLQGAKVQAYEGLRTICQLIKQGDHLTLNGMREIVQISYRMNLGKRRRSESELLRVLDEVKG